MGAWIETKNSLNPLKSLLSHPMWVRGLKQKSEDYLVIRTEVAPHVGAWIETLQLGQMIQNSNVAPHVGTWIETYLRNLAKADKEVAPHVGAWIETHLVEPMTSYSLGRTPCGCVD